jgi:hypothetical protein
MKAQAKLWCVVAGAFAIGGGVSCDETDNEGCSVDPAGEITLSNGTSTEVYTVGQYHTFALAYGTLQPVSSDTSGTHTVSFEHFDSGDHNMELLVFDVDWADVIVNGYDPLAHYFPYPGAHYKTVPGGTSINYSVGGSNWYGTWHIIRQNRGLCRISLPWASLFSEMSTEFLNALIARPEVTQTAREFEHMQASYVGENVNLHHGFTWEGNYYVEGNVLDFSAMVWLNAGFGFYPRESDGLVDVETLAVRTYGYDGNITVVKGVADAMKAAVRNIAADQIEQALEDLANIPVPIGSCQVSDPLSTQQSDCYEAMMQDVDGKTVAYGFFLQLMDDAEYDDNGWDIEYLAEKMSDALDPRNFACVQTNYGDSCAVHPIIQNINVRPTTLEFVVASDTQDYATKTELLFLYGLGLPLLMEMVGAGDPDDVSIKCVPPSATPSSGTLPIFQQPYLILP